MSCLTRDQAILWKKPMTDGERAEFWVKSRQIMRDLDRIMGRLTYEHCSSCDHEYTGDTWCPQCGSAAFA